MPASRTRAGHSQSEAAARDDAFTPFKSCDTGFLASRDVEVFAHEMGHAFQLYRSTGQSVSDYDGPTMDGAEIHSMSLEFLTWPHMERFFGDDAERFRRHHLIDALLFLPYGAAVDHFQHEVYSRPHLSPADRHAVWSEMGRTYLPWRDWGDLAHPAGGRAWQRQRHIYGAPFYYIDYVLALTCALQFWARAAADPAGTLADYVALCGRGGSAPFRELVRSAGLASPFDDACLADNRRQGAHGPGLTGTSPVVTGSDGIFFSRTG